MWQDSSAGLRRAAGLSLGLGFVESFWRVVRRGRMFMFFVLAMGVVVAGWFG